MRLKALMVYGTNKENRVCFRAMLSAISHRLFDPRTRWVAGGAEPLRLANPRSIRRPSHVLEDVPVSAGYAASIG